MAGHVAIVGAGFSGTLLAVQLVRAGPSRVTLIDRSAAPGRGLAYGAAHPMHLLNVRATGMSAFPDEPDHFAAYAQRSGCAGGGVGFAPRRLYGDYLQALLEEALADGRLTVVRGDAVDLRQDNGVNVALADGREIAADRVVLALGNPPPTPLPGIDTEALGRRYAADPWAQGATEGIDGPVFIIGTGLTMVDIVLLLERHSASAPILAVSRRGLLPRPHADPVSYEPRAERPAETGGALLRSVRRRGREIGWRQAVDELRPFTQKLWRDAPVAERRRFLRHLRPWWDVHRHRLAPALHARIADLIVDGRLEVAAGRLLGASLTPDGAEVRWRRRGGDADEHFTAARIINCTGPEGQLRASSEPLLRRLAAAGLARPGQLGLGIDVDAQARVIGADGRADPRLYALGPLTRGALWEITAVPDIRVQVAEVAAAISGSAA